MGSKIRVIIMIMCLSMLNAGTYAQSADVRYVGGDISLLPENEDAGAKYTDYTGAPIADVVSFLHDEGMNAMRVRVFVNPSDYSGDDADANASQTIGSVIPLCKRIKNAGMALMLDFHYSDTWADPGQQYTPKQWSAMTDEELNGEIYRYTRESLLTLREEGIVPDFIQTGNEISFGMLWGGEGTPESEQKKTFMGSAANWDRLGNLLRNAGKACREVCPDARIILHTERTGDVAVQNNFYDEMKRMDIDYDIIGLSYYPYFHGPLSSLEIAIESLENNFPDKDIMVVETGYSYKWEVPGTTERVDYPYSEEGQDEFANALVGMLLRHARVNGLFWWWLEYNAYGTTLTGWYNAPLFDSSDGRALSALKTLCGFASGEGIVESVLWKDDGEDIFYNLNGLRRVSPGKGLYISAKRHHVLRR